MEQATPKILVVDDDPGLCDLLQRYLSEQGFEVSVAADGEEMDERLKAQPVDLLILDLMLPGEDGLAIARRLRSESGLPIIILSARGDEVDRIVGLEVGADDYLPKPFNPRELLARIRAVLRRQVDNETPEDASEGHQVFQFGDFTLDLASHQLTNTEGNVPLTSSEFSLLEIFVQHPNWVLSRDKLVDLLKGYDRSPYDRSIDIRVTRLRRKIEQDPSDPRFILTIWGEGYLFSPQGKADAD
jgi:DNA-binding response OmpR family regulator